MEDAAARFRRMIPVLEGSIAPVEECRTRAAGHRRRMDTVAAAVEYLERGWAALADELTGDSGVAQLGRIHANVAHALMDEIRAVREHVDRMTTECDMAVRAAQDRVAACEQEAARLVCRIETERSADAASRKRRPLAHSSAAESTLVHAWFNQPPACAASDRPAPDVLTRVVAVGTGQ